MFLNILFVKLQYGSLIDNLLFAWILSDFKQTKQIMTQYFILLYKN